MQNPTGCKKKKKKKEKKRRKEGAPNNVHRVIDYKT